MESPLAVSPVLLAVGVLLLGYWSYQTYHDVVWRRTKQFGGWPQLQPSLIWGHAVKVNDLRKQFPAKCHIGKALTASIKTFPDSPRKV